MIAELLYDLYIAPSATRYDHSEVRSCDNEREQPPCLLVGSEQALVSVAAAAAAAAATAVGVIMSRIVSFSSKRRDRESSPSPLYLLTQCNMISTRQVLSLDKGKRSIMVVISLHPQLLYRAKH